MEVPMINWPTAFVIAVAMISGTVLINKPSDAAFGGEDGMISVGNTDGVSQLKGSAVRLCYSKSTHDPIICGDWKN